MSIDHDIDPSQTQAPLPTGPIVTLEQLSEELEHVTEELLAHLGELASGRINQTELGWVDRVSDASERVQRATDRIFVVINELPLCCEDATAEAGPVVALVLVPAPIEKGIKISPADQQSVDELLTFAQINPWFSAEQARKVCPSLTGTDSATFKRIRALALQVVGQSGQTVAWAESGKTRGKRYNLTGLTSPWEPTYVSQTPAETDLPTAPVIETSDVSISEQALPENDEVSSKPKFVRQESQEAYDNRLTVVEALAQRPLEFGKLLWVQYKVGRMPADLFQVAKADIEAAVASGVVIKLEDGRYKLVPLTPEQSPKAALTARGEELFDGKIKSLRRSSGIQAAARKPKDRQRYR